MVRFRIPTEQLKSEIWQFKIQKHLKSGLFEARIPNGQFLKGYASIQYLDVSVKIVDGFWLNGSHLSEFQIAFEIWVGGRGGGKSRLYLSLIQLL